MTRPGTEVEARETPACRATWWGRHWMAASRCVLFARRGSLPDLDETRKAGILQAREWGAWTSMEAARLVRDHVAFENALVDSAVRGNAGGVRIAGDVLAENAEALTSALRRGLSAFPAPRFRALMETHMALFVARVRRAVEEDAWRDETASERENTGALARFMERL